jgi:uncharacterized protein (TIGR00255 family)
MPHSMTGFATADEAVPPYRLVWEIRGVNHRFLELALRLPEDLRGLEPECRDRVGEAVKRGKVDCALKVVVLDDAPQEAVVEQSALRALKKLERDVLAVFPDAGCLSVSEILRWPGVVKEGDERFETLRVPALRCLERALQAFNEARRREGERIGELLEKRNAAIDASLEGLRPLLEGAQARHRDKLRERLTRLDVQAEPERLEQELALIAQRFDVAEEIDRLAGHIAETRAVLARNEPIGRRLDFLIQELNREANTFASKVQDETLTRAAVELKVLIEQMREQVQNLE